MKPRIYFITIFYLLLVLHSCSGLKLYEMYKSHAVEITTASEDIAIINNNVLIDLKNSSGISETFLFDTGFSGSLCVFRDISPNNGIAAGKTYFSDDSSVISNFSFTNYQNKIFLGSNVLTTSLPSLGSALCSKNISGIMGMIDFYNSESQLHMDFLNNRITVSDDLDHTQYKQVKAKIINARIYIELELFGETNFYLFDTGNRTYATTTNQKIISPVEIWYTVGITSANKLSHDPNKIKEFVFNKNVQVRIENVKTYINTSQSSKNNIGILFIKNFNWIIDFKNNAVYFKPINLPDSAENANISNNIFSTQGQNLILMSTREASNKSFLSKRVISVDREKITDINICAMKDRLNNTKDLNLSNLVFSK